MHRPSTTVLAAIAALTATPLASATGDAVTLEIIARPGDPAPGTDEFFQSSGTTGFKNCCINNSGTVQFLALIDPIEPNEVTVDGTWTGVPGALSLWAIEEQIDPTVTYLYDLDTPPANLSDTGDVMLRVQLGGAGVTNDTQRRIWTSIECASEGTPAPGTSETFENFYDQPLFINSLGAVAFKGTLTGPNETDFGIWMHDGSTLSLHTREGEPAPGMPAGTVFGIIRNLTAFDDAGRIMMDVDLAGPGIDGNNDDSIWYGLPGALQLIARKGDPVPGLPNLTFSVVDTFPSLNSSGIVGFTGVLAGDGVDQSNNRVMLTGTPGNLTIRARKGDPAPGADGALFDFIDEPAIAANGHIAFYATLSGPDVDSTNDRGIWAGPPDAYEMVAREGDVPPEADAGDVWTFHDHPSINAVGQVVFRGTYENAGFTYPGIWATDTGGNLLKVLRAGDVIDLGGGDMRTVNGLTLDDANGHGTGGADGRRRALNDAGQIALVAQLFNSPTAMKTVIRATVGDGTGPVGDVDGDGDVDVSDLLDLLAAWGPCGGCPEDIDGDGTVDVVDLLALLGGWT